MTAATKAAHNAPQKVDGEILAAIGAAVTLFIRKPHKILSVEQVVQQLEAPLYILNPWSMEGRFQHFGSHKVR